EPDALAVSGGDLFVANVASDTVTEFPATTISPPTVTGLSPSSGPAAGGSIVNISGSGFTGATAVHFGKVSASFVVESRSLVSALAPPGAGTVNVTVTNPGGRSVAGPSDKFTYVSGSTVVLTGLTRTSGPTDGGMWETITGVNLQHVKSFLFGTRSVTPYSPGCPSTSCTIVIPSQSKPRTVSISATTTGGTTVGSSLHFTYGTPKVGLSRTSMSFSGHVSTLSAPKYVTITNIGTSLLPLLGVRLASAGTGTGYEAYGIVESSGILSPDQNACQGVVLAPGQTCTVGVALDTEILKTTRSATLEVFDGHSVERGSVALTGSAAGPTIARVTSLPNVGDPEVAITGVGFGEGFPSTSLGVPSSTGDVEIADTTADWVAGDPSNTNCQVTVQSWSNTSIALTADVNNLLSPCSLHDGDTIEVTVDNNESKPSSTSGAHPTTVVAASGVTPSVSDVSPDFTAAGSASTTAVTISGSGFVDTADIAAVLFGSQAASGFSANSAGTQITIPASGVPVETTAEGVSVTVVTTGGMASAPPLACDTALEYFAYCPASFFYLAEQPFVATLDGALGVGLHVGTESVGVDLETTAGSVTASRSIQPIEYDTTKMACGGAPQISGEASVMVSGSLDATVSGSFGVASNDLLPSAALAQGTIDISSGSLQVAVKGSVSGQEYVPLIGIPCGIALYAVITGSGSLSDTWGITFHNLDASLAGGEVNGQSVSGSALGVTGITCDGVALTAQSPPGAITNCVNVLPNQLALTASVTVSLWVQDGPDYAHVGLGPEFSFTYTATGTSGCADVAVEGALFQKYTIRYTSPSWQFYKSGSSPPGC
ncbi:MAG: IPT/TIG domain-containing protein, partial [Acidimicrobiales bacterium]